MIKAQVLYTSKCRVSLVGQGIIENRILDGHQMEVEDVLELKQANIQLSEGKPYAVLVTFGHLTEVSKESRELIASKDFVKNTVAKALLVNNIGHRLVGNFYLSVNRPAIRTHVFTNREQAIEWLSTELKKSQKML